MEKKSDTPRAGDSASVASGHSMAVPEGSAQSRGAASPPASDSGDFDLGKFSMGSIGSVSDTAEKSVPSVRVQRKADAHRGKFGVSPDETLLNVYLCALKRGGLLQQGKVYVFDRHICFHASVFGHHTYLSIHTSDVTSVEKCTNMGFPNSLRIRYADKKVILTSFLNRQEAYSDIALCVGINPEPDDDSTVEMITGPVKWLAEKLTKESATSTYETHDLPDNEVMADEESDDGATTPGGQDIVKELENAEGQPPMPPLPDTMQQILEFELPCTPSKFWSHFLSDESGFIRRFHEQSGDAAVKLSQWQQLEKAGIVRDLQFVKTLAQKMGPDKAFCAQTQRLTVHSGPSLLFQTCQVMDDIPYSDHFQVETCWRITPAGKGCKVSINLAVPFTKKTMLKSVIEKGARSGAVASLTRFKEMAIRSLSGDGAQLEQKGKGAAALQAAAPPAQPAPPSGGPSGILLGMSLAPVVLGAVAALILVLQLVILWRLADVSARAVPQPPHVALSMLRAEIADLVEHSAQLAQRSAQWAELLEKLPAG